MPYQEGYIKYQCVWTPAPAPDTQWIQAVNDWRTLFFQKNLIGYNETLEAGFGNISCRHPQNPGMFIISATQTGHIPILSPHHYTTVTQYNLEKNTLACSGPLKASSESLTHAATYLLSPEINCVIHIHHPQMWSHYLNHLPTTSPEATYGTPEMAFEVQRLWRETLLPEKRTFVMGGHVEGLVSFGKNPAEAAEILLFYYQALFT
ncbi:MAG: class II aldolase/adducin family protein [Bacteroidia bacterium]